MITETNRGYYGGSDGKAINRHSFRDFKVDGIKQVTFTVDKNLSCFPPYYEVQVSFDNVNGILNLLKHTIPEGASWKKTMAISREVILNYAKELLS